MRASPSGPRSCRCCITSINCLTGGRRVQPAKGELNRSATGWQQPKGDRPNDLAWWTLVVFIGGGCTGILLMAVMRAAAGLPEQSDPCRWIEKDPIRLPSREERICGFRCRDSFVDAHHLSQADNEDRQFESQYFERRGRQRG